MKSLVGLAVVVALGLILMVIYTLLGHRRDPDATRKGSHFAAGLGDFLIHWFVWLLGPVERLSLRLRIRPDLFNYVGLGCGLLSGILIATGQVQAGGWLIAAGGATDILDGRIARARRLVSDYGRFIDSTLDRFVEVLVFLGIAVHLRRTPWGATIAGAAIGGSLLVSYARARGESVGVPGPKGLMQRAERIVLTFLACLFDPTLCPYWGLAPGTILTVAMAVIAVASFLTATYRTTAIAVALCRSGSGATKSAQPD